MSAYRLSLATPALGIGRTAAGLENLVRLLVFVILLAMTAAVLAGVISRYVFNDSFSWTEEFAIWCFTWLIFLGAALGIRQKRHVAADFLPDSLPAWLDAMLGFAQSLVLSLTLIMMLFGGYQLADMVGGTSASLQWPKAIKYAVIPISGVVALIFLLARDIEDNRVLVRNLLAMVAAALIYLGLDHGLLGPLQGSSPSLIMLAAFFMALGVGVPVSFALMFGVFLASSASFILPAPAVVQNMVTGSTKFILLAIPFFLSTGYLLNLGGLSTRLIDFATSLVGHLRGGLAHVNILNSLMVGGISGSSSADAASSTKILVPEMVSRGYSPAFSCAVTASSAILPNVVPPAIAMLVYASVANVSIARLFMAGIVPAIMAAGALMLVAYWISVRRHYQTATERAPLSAIGHSFVRALPVLVITVGVLGGIRFGVITATEAGVVALLWTFMLGKLVFKAYDWKQFYRAFVECATDAALVGFLIAASVPFAWILIAEQVPQEIVSWAGTAADSQFGLFVILLLVLAAAGMFLDLTPAMLIIAPLFLPMMTSAGVDPVQLGIVMIITLQLGGVSPPVGLLVFISSQIAKVSPSAVFRAVVPFIAATMVIVLLLCVFPSLTIGLWDLIE
ncbi:TRAP transporter large permease [Modicisalibacter radicis]|uniref:TRAP transporter large permease n=1 Tax=Halomonas sp. EAR18 TaxID=2518972 RepID=UPI00109D37DF|nr:TRAP transporter large permease subunit [Halomonas sp. EAR18]